MNILLNNSKKETKHDERLVHVLALLGDTTRFKMFKLMMRKTDLCVTEIAAELKISVSAASQSFKQFELLGVVGKKRLGKKICYEINNDDLLVRYMTNLISK
ncbi:MAG: ArsR family transcriptional regulator [Patescibacteria group bacterium]